MRPLHLLSSLALLALPMLARAEVCNLKVVTDASPDYSDLPSMVHSITSKWETPEQKCWAMFYWNHKARRQTAPMILHGMAHTDPIRQFNDYGYTMCSTISGVNQSIWEAMGLKHRYWDISNHTVCEVFYDGRWHMYDNSLSAIYTLCDGKTLAGVEDIGKAGACEASGGKSEPGHIAKYHCLTATSPRGFLEGADCARSLDEEYRCFNPNGLKLRTYFYDWDYGHRYILNLKSNETYTRYYHSLGDGPEYFVPNANGKDPESVNKRYRIRGNGEQRLTVSYCWPPGDWQNAIYSSRNMKLDRGARPEKRGEPCEVVFRVHSANVVTGMAIKANFIHDNPEDELSIALSTTNGLHWKEAWKPTQDQPDDAELRLDEVRGSYDILIKVRMVAKNDVRDIGLCNLQINTTTALNSKTQPRLNLGKNTVYVGAGDQTESIVFWPELHNSAYKQMIIEEKNIVSTKKHPGFQGTLHATKPKEDAYIVYRIDAPADLTKLTYGGRFYNRAPKSHIDLYHSFDNKTWTKSWTLTDTAQPWDVIHYETIDIPRGNRSVYVKYLLNSPEASSSGCSIYAVRMEANYAAPAAKIQPVEVTFAWSEVQADRSLIKRSHTQVADKLPFTYTINVGGTDHPAMESLAISLADQDAKAEAKYSDGKDVGGEKFVGKWVTYGKNLAVGKKYTLSHPSLSNWGAGDPNGDKLTDGVAGPSYAGGTSYGFGVIWKDKTNPTITLDLGQSQSCASFGMNFHGYPWYDALKGQIKDKVEVLVSEDGQKYESVGFLQTDLRWKDLPANYMWPDEETITGLTFRCVPPQPVRTRFVQYKITSPRMICPTELEVLDSIKLEPFDLRVALPK